MAFPVEFASRGLQAFLRGPITTFAFCFGTMTAIRGGRQHHGLIVDFPTPQDNAVDDFGIQSGGGFTVEIADEENVGGIDGQGPDWYVLLEDFSRIVLEDGSGDLIMEY